MHRQLLLLLIAMTIAVMLLVYPLEDVAIYLSRPISESIVHL